MGPGDPYRGGRGVLSAGAAPFVRLAAQPLGLRLVGLALCAGLITAESFMTSGSGHHRFTPPYLFNLGHPVLFGLLAFLLVLVLGTRAPWHPGAWLLVLGVTAAAGFCDEWHQAYQAGRDSSLLDLGSDVLGGFLALCLARWAAREDRSRVEGLHLAALSLTAVLLWAFLPSTIRGVPLPFVHTP